MNDIDGLLALAGITPSPAPANESNDSLDETDIEDILSSHGFTESPNNESEALDEMLDAMDNEEHQGMEATDMNEDAAPNELENENIVSSPNPPDSSPEVVSALLDEPVEEAEWQDSQESQDSQEDSTLPLNSNTLLLDETTSRFSGTEWYKEIQRQRVILAGLGGIGSYCAYNLARMHLASLVLYDDDVVDLSNLSGQFYNIDDVGKSKVSAVKDALTKYSATTCIYALPQKFERTSEAGDIMICGFDNMTARRTFFHSWKKHVMELPYEQRKRCLFLDGRLSISVMQVFCITGDDDYSIRTYEYDYLFSDSEADPRYNVCSLKQTTYLASMIGALMTNLFTNFVANLLEPVIPYKLPFFTEYDANYMIFKEVG